MPHYCRRSELADMNRQSGQKTVSALRPVLRILFFLLSGDAFPAASIPLRNAQIRGQIFRSRVHRSTSLRDTLLLRCRNFRLREKRPYSLNNRHGQQGSGSYFICNAFPQKDVRPGKCPGRMRH
jgi:hypothetical protein